MDRLTAEEASRRADVSGEFFGRLVDEAVLKSGDDGLFSAGDARRANLVQSLVDTGVGIADLATLIRDGRLSLEFPDMEAYERLPR